jgi:hypothetical protein
MRIADFEAAKVAYTKAIKESPNPFYYSNRCDLLLAPAALPCALCRCSCLRLTRSCSIWTRRPHPFFLPFPAPGLRL